MNSVVPARFFSFSLAFAWGCCLVAVSRNWFSFLCSWADRFWRLEYDSLFSCQFTTCVAMPLHTPRSAERYGRTHLNSTRMRLVCNDWTESCSNMIFGHNFLWTVFFASCELMRFIANHSIIPLGLMTTERISCFYASRMRYGCRRTLIKIPLQVACPVPPGNALVPMSRISLRAHYPTDRLASVGLLSATSWVVKQFEAFSIICSHMASSAMCTWITGMIPWPGYGRDSMVVDVSALDAPITDFIGNDSRRARAADLLPIASGLMTIEHPAELWTQMVHDFIVTIDWHRTAYGGTVAAPFAVPLSFNPL